MTLGEKQEKFTTMLYQLLHYLIKHGYRVRLKHLLRCNDCKIGHPNSLHESGLAIDIVCMRGDQPMIDTDDYLEIGEYWESIGGSWGGRFQDGGHFSLEHNGMR